MSSSIKEQRTPSTPPTIARLPHDTKKYRWSVMIPAYNCLPFLQATIESVLMQDKGEELMQIEVVDDCSSDGNLLTLIESIGKGRVKYYRQLENKGSLRNFETCINRAEGEFVHLLHGDDLVLPGFYDEVECLFQQYPQVGSVITNYCILDEKGIPSEPRGNLQDSSGILNDWFTLIASGRKRVQPPAVVVRRGVYENLGSFFAVHYGEDWEMWTRIAANYAVAYSTKPLALYRGGQTSSISANYTLSGQSFDDLIKVIDIIGRHIPNSERKKFQRSARTSFSKSYALSGYRHLAKSKDNIAIFISLAKTALRFGMHPKTILYILKGGFLYPFLLLRSLIGK